MNTKCFTAGIAAVLLFLAAACTKTVDPEALPQNTITSYKVSNIQDTAIYGAIDNIENTITVYIPYYYSVSVIDPEITVEQGAKLTGTIEPVPVTDTTQTYQVKGADGSSRTYHLIIVQQNTPYLNLYWGMAAPSTYPGGSIGITGNFLSTSTTTLSIAVVSRATGDTLAADPGVPAPKILTTAEGYTNYALSYYVPVNADSGYYDVHIRFLGHQVNLDTPLHVVYYQPLIAGFFGTQTWKPSSDITFYPQSENMLFINPQWVKATVNNVTYTLAIQNSTTRQQLVVQLPAGFPTGALGTVTFTAKIGNWDEQTFTVDVTVAN